MYNVHTSVLIYVIYLVICTIIILDPNIWVFSGHSRINTILFRFILMVKKNKYYVSKKEAFYH